MSRERGNQMAKKNEEVNEETLDKETEKTAEPKEAEKSNEEVLEEKLKELPMSHRDTRKFARFFLAGASQVEVDKQGRILIPNVLREFAGLEKDVVFLGVGSRIEIWSRQAWDGEGNFDDMDDIAERMADLGLSI